MRNDATILKYNINKYRYTFACNQTEAGFLLDSVIFSDPPQIATDFIRIPPLDQKEKHAPPTSIHTQTDFNVPFSTKYSNIQK